MIEQLSFAKAQNGYSIEYMVQPGLPFRKVVVGDQKALLFCIAEILEIEIEMIKEGKDATI